MTGLGHVWIKFWMQGVCRDADQLCGFSWVKTLFLICDMCVEVENSDSGQVFSYLLTRVPGLNLPHSWFLHLPKRNDVHLIELSGRPSRITYTKFPGFCLAHNSCSIKENTTKTRHRQINNAKNDKNVWEAFSVPGSFGDGRWHQAPGTRACSDL